jgi:hypothetical protein
MEGGAVGHNVEMELPKDYPSHFLFALICFSGFRGENLIIGKR